MTIDIQKLRELLAKATPGVWLDDPECAPLRVFSDYIPPGKTASIAPVICETLPYCGERRAQGQANAALIAAMQAALPSLLDEIEALRKENKNLKDNYQCLGCGVGYGVEHDPNCAHAPMQGD